MAIHCSCPWQHADTKQLLYKLSPATSASKELYTGAAQTLVNLGCFINKSHWNIKTGVTLRFSLIAELLRAKCVSGAPWVRKWSYLPIWENLVITWPCTDRHTDRPSDRPSAPQAYQCKITRSTGMATQIQIEVILAGNRIATGVL